VRFGIIGSLSAINSPIASTESIATLSLINERKRESVQIQPARCAPHATTAGAVNDEPGHQFRFQRARTKRSSMKCFFTLVPPKNKLCATALEMAIEK